MAPIEADISNSNIRPIGLFASYLAAASGLTFFVSRNILFKAFKSLPPSQATRIRTTNRRKHVILFTSLAVVSLIVTIWQMFRVLSLSYRAWAYEMGQSLPQSWVGEGGVWGEGKTGLALGRWLEDTDLLNDALEIAVEKSRRYWWTQQLILAAAAWSIYLSVEGLGTLLISPPMLTNHRASTEHSTSVGIHAPCPNCWTVFCNKPVLRCCATYVCSTSTTRERVRIPESRCKTETKEVGIFGHVNVNVNSEDN